MRATATGHLTSRLPAAALERRPQVPLRQEQLQGVCRVCFCGAGVGGSQVQGCEPTVGLTIQVGSVLQEQTHHSDAAPAAGAVKGCPAIHGARVDFRAGGDQSRHHIKMAAVCCTVQWSVAVLVAAVHQQGVSS